MASRTGSAGKPATIVRDGAIDGRGNLVYGLFDNVDVRSESRYDELSTEFSQFTLSFEHEFSDRFRVDAHVGTSRSAFDNPIQTTVTLDHVDADNVSWDYRGDDRLPLIDYGFDVNNPANWTFANGLSEIRLRPQEADNTFDNAELNLAFDLNDVWTLKGGVLWKKYEFQTSEQRRASETVVPALPAGTSVADLSRILRLNNLDVPNGTAVSWIAPDAAAFARLFNIYSNSGTFALTNTVAGLVPADIVACGEVGLGGELRQVAHTPRRLAEAARLGFKRAVLPFSAPAPPPGIVAIRVGTLIDAVERLQMLPR